MWPKIISLVQSVQIFVTFHYAIVFRGISNSYGTKYPILIEVAASVITIYFVLFSLTILTICGCYKMIVYLYLMLRYGKTFKGMITGMDMLTILAPGCDGSVHGLTRCSTTHVYNGHNVYNQLCHQVHNQMFEKQVDRKLFSTREYTILGYHYFKETFGVQVKDVVKTIQAPNKLVTDPIGHDELMELATDYYNSDLPVGNKFNWDLCLCLNPVLGCKESSKTYFVLLHRMHHVLGDGLVIYNILANNLFKFGPEFRNYSENLVNKCKKIKTKRANHVFKFGRKILIDKPCVLRDGQRHVRTIFTNKVEESSTVELSYLDKIKIIRDHYPGVMTFNIFMTAYSAALAEYYLKYSTKLSDVPEAMETTHPVQLDVNRYLDIYSSPDKIQLSNEVSNFQFTCPIIPSTKRGIPIKDYLVERMLSIKDEFDKALNSMDVQANYIWVSLYFAVFPYQITRNLFHGVFLTTLTTCMPGGPKLKLFNDDVVEDCTYLLPRQYYSTLALSINTYDRRLEVGVTADKDKVGNLEKLNEIRDGLFKYLDLLYDQVCAM